MGGKLIWPTIYDYLEEHTYTRLRSIDIARELGLNGPSVAAAIYGKLADDWPQKFERIDRSHFQWKSKDAPRRRTNGTHPAPGALEVEVRQAPRHADDAECYEEIGELKDGAKLLRSTTGDLFAARPLVERTS